MYHKLRADLNTKCLKYNIYRNIIITVVRQKASLISPVRKHHW